MDLTQRFALLMGALALLLVGCSDGDSGGSSGGGGFFGATPASQSPLQPLPADTPVQPTQPVQPTPEQAAQPTPVQPTSPGGTPVAGGALPTAFFNGESTNDARSAWQCRSPGNTEANAFYTLAFYRDGRGLYATNGTQENFGWTTTGLNVSFDLNSQGLRVVLQDIAFTSNSQFTTLVVVNQGEGDPRECNLVGRAADDEQPPVNTPMQPATPVQPTNPGSGDGSLAAMLSNGGDLNSVNSTWDCFFDDGSRTGVLYLDNGRAFFLLPDDTFEFTWQINAAGDIVHTASNGFQLFINSPVFSSSSSWASSRVFTDAEEAGALQCTRLIVTG